MSHPWAKQYRQTLDPLELWLDVERQVMGDREKPDKETLTEKKCVRSEGDQI